MTRLHIPFRSGGGARLKTTQIHARAAQLRQDALAQNLKDYPGTKESSLSLHSALRALGGRIKATEQALDHPLDQTLALEVWGPEDFVLYESHFDYRRSVFPGFAFIGSYLMHYLDCPEKWIAEDGSSIGMQWSAGRDGESALKGLARKEAFVFAWEVIAPFDVVKDAIDLMGEKDYYMPFAGTLSRAEIKHRAEVLGLISPKDAAA
jgi:hypothetical protein